MDHFSPSKTLLKAGPILIFGLSLAWLSLVALNPFELSWGWRLSLVAIGLLASGFGFRGLSRLMKERTYFTPANPEGSGAYRQETGDNHYRDIFQQASEGIVVVDRERYTILECNQAAANILGGSLAELSGIPMIQFPVANERNSLRQLIHSSKNRGTKEKVFAFHSLKGEKVEVAIWGSKIRLGDRDRTLLGIRDIRAHVANQKDLERSKERLMLFRELLNHSGDAIFVLDPFSGKILDFNDETQQSLGYNRDEMRGLHIFGFGLAEDHQPIPEDILAELREQGKQIFMGRHQRKDGTSFPVEVSISHIQLNGREYLLGIARNTAERLAQEEALRLSEQRYRTLVERMNEGLIMTGEDEEVLFVNNRMCEILGMSKEELEGRKSFEILQGDSSRPIITQKSALRKQGISDQYELNLRKHNGDRIWVLVAGSPYLNSRGVPVGTIAIITDITDRKLTEIKLQEKNNELDAFVYKASHDLKGPLASIIGVTNIARDEVQDPSADLYLDMIEKSTKRLDLILSELIDVTRINKAKLNLAPTQLRETVDNLLSTVEHMPGRSDVEVRIDIAESLSFPTDSKLMFSILQNLLVNAINYRNRSSEQSFVSIQMRVEKDRLKIDVHDNGTGIPDRMKAKVFDMFFRGTNESKGSGLGLYIVKRAVDKLQGWVEMESEEGKGTQFHMTFPLITTHADSFD
ncbi:PAS domain S-box protein [Pontibacter sp. G13]|uniref:PAS domain S-box protein n=1 Tax=Pontibacter sp. G13 TaxID=3074898 RepID=UPI00288A4307|nr:PAS domain S-box protein [Pontibacter sp. G13]WNJ18565.1 PAS domain S-box protein [Pontibacter sp. G13]